MKRVSQTRQLEREPQMIYDLCRTFRLRTWAPVEVGAGVVCLRYLLPCYLVLPAVVLCTGLYVLCTLCDSVRVGYLVRLFGGGLYI